MIDPVVLLVLLVICGLVCFMFGRASVQQYTTVFDLQPQADGKLVMMTYAKPVTRRDDGEIVRGE
ncbi:MAG: hypothetical protein IT366_21450 [Candidatus Hydrogenedentes bacterium]|nr:hypothetical protein [Candidatus Hydrogenedentota bacterium]